MQTGENEMKPGEAAENLSEIGHERKQRWKKRPGNRYTPEQLRLMAQSAGDIRICASRSFISCAWTEM